MKIFEGKNTKILSWADEIEKAAMQQIMQMAELDIIPNHIAIMPDVHAGIGATVGTVIPTYRAVIPAAVGVDIGCGMCAVKTDINANELPDSLAAIRSAIEGVVPVGFAMHQEDSDFYSIDLMVRLKKIVKKYEKINPEKWLKQMGTLGGGNHFIELCLDQDNYLWIMLHSGSRGIGNQIGQLFIEKAKEDMGQFLGTLPHQDLAYLTFNSKFYLDYIHAVKFAQDYAYFNRNAMMIKVCEILTSLVREFDTTEAAINCHHNYIEFFDDILLTRKGAVSAKDGEMGIIPGSMGTKSYIVRGKGNIDSHQSCSHGAGRIMSRSEARKKFTVEDLEQQTAGIECRKDAAVLDEIPGAYKDIDLVMKQQSDLVDIVHTLRQIMCIKG